MNKKDELKLDLLSNIKDEIIDKQSEKRYKLMTQKRRRFPKWIIPSGAAAAILIAALIPILLLLFSKQVPVYEGMTVLENFDGSSAQAAPSYSIDMLTNTNNNGNHYGHDKKPIRDIVEDDPTISLTVPEQQMYYADPGQDIYINIHISNPDNFVILSFMLNGKMYSSYMFEEGSDMENIVLKVNVGDAAGVVEYTIDAIKYVDGTEIKDVIMEGDRTVKVGVYSEGIQPEVSTTNELVGINEISFTANLSDKYALIERSGGKAYAILFGEDNIISHKELTAGENEITFDGLDTYTSYRYGIVAYYDSLDGNGMTAHVMLEKEFTTQSVVAIGGVEIDQTSIDFNVIFNEVFESKALSSMALYHGDDKVKDFDVSGDITQSIFSATELLSNNTYKLVLMYENLGKTETVEFELMTEAKAEPTFAIKDVVADTYTVSGSYNQTNVDNTLISYKVEIYKGDELVSENTDKKIEFTSLDYYTDYTVKITYTFDVNDGKGVQTKTVEQTIKTHPYIEIISLQIPDKKEIYQDGDKISMYINVNNPLMAKVSTVIIDGQNYAVDPSSLSGMLLVNVNDVAKLGDKIIDGFILTIDGTQYEVSAITESKIDIEVMGIITINSWEVVDENFEPLEYAAVSDKVYMVIDANGLEGNTITDLCLQIGKYKSGFVNGQGNVYDYAKRLDYLGNEIKKLDDGRIYVEFDTSEFGNLTVERVSITYQNTLINSAEATNETYFQNPFIVLKSSDIRSVSNVDEFMNMENGYHYKLTCDLDFSSVTDWYGLDFVGIFDGNGYSIKNYVLILHENYDGDIGLFKSLTGIVENTNMIGFKFMNTSYRYSSNGYDVGSVVGEASRCSIIRNCSTNVTTEINHLGAANIGGICGYSLGVIEDCVNNATVTVRGENFGGGIAGSAQMIIRCENYGAVTGYYDTDSVNGVGANVIKDSNNYGTIEKLQDGGAPKGISGDIVENCHNYGEVIQKDTVIEEPEDHITQ